MKKFIPKAARHRVIKDAVATPAPPLASGAPMTMLRVPSALAGAENCVTPLVCRRTVSDAFAQVYLGRTYAFTGEPAQSFASLGRVRGFALTGTIAAWAPGPAIENKPPSGVEVPALATIVVNLIGLDRRMPDVSDFDALSDSTLLFCGGEILSVARASMQPDGSYYLTVLERRFGTPADSKAGDTVWIASRARLKFFEHPTFVTGNTSKFKITVGKQPLANAIPFEIKL